MTHAEWKTALMYEAAQLGHAEARTKAKEKAAQSLVQEGKLVLGGTIGDVSVGGQRARWYKLANPKIAEDVRTEAERHPAGMR